MSCLRACFALSIASLILPPATAGAQEMKKLPLGISKTKPTRGPFVETDQGFMVPYTISIPGREDVRFTMVPVPAGTFQMGSPSSEKGRKSDEGPQLKVNVEPFWMGKTEVSWAEYKVFMDTYEIFKNRVSDQSPKVVTDKNRADAITAPTPLYEPGTTYQLGEDDEHPAVTMTQYAARQYTKWMSLMTGSFYRLPTESEWEYAARAGSEGRYFFGDDATQMGEYAWYTDNSDDVYHHVGTKKANPFGLHDIYGNVAELVIDQYEADAYQKLAGKKLLATETIMPTTKIFPQVVRGGSWDSSTADLRSAARSRTGNGSSDDGEDWRESDPNIPLSPWWFTEDPAGCVGFRMLRPLKTPKRDVQEKFWELYSNKLTRDVEGRILGGRGVWGFVDPSLAKEIKEAGE